MMKRRHSERRKATPLEHSDEGERSKRGLTLEMESCSRNRDERLALDFMLAAERIRT